MKRTRVDREFSAEVRQQILERADGRCEICWVRPVSCYHHRLRRSQGGMGTLENGMGLCDGPGGSCHDRVHENRAGESYERGWLLRPGPVEMGLKS